MKLAIVTATLDMDRSATCRLSWTKLASDGIDVYTVRGGADPQGVVQPGWEGRYMAVFDGKRTTYYTAEILGVVPAFAIGVQKALEGGAEIIACLHDDLLIEQPGWDQVVRQWFTTHPEVGLVGFGGGVGLGDSDIYQKPYDPMQLARQGFVSNMRDAEAHGARSTEPVQVACLDGFSQIGRAAYWRGYAAAAAREIVRCPTCRSQGFHPSATTNFCAFCDGQENNQIESQQNLFELMQRWGIIHHMYDGALGCFAKRLGWQTWMLPIKCHHFGGQTAVADTRYHEWANTQGVVRDVRGHMATGDQGFWLKAHQIVYEQFRDTLPIRL